MAQPQPLLDAKREYFSHFQTLPHSDDEDGDKVGDQEDEDGLDPREMRMRQRHRRFFRQPSSSPGRPPAANQQVTAGRKEQDDAVQAAPPEEEDVVVTSSAKATPLVKKKTTTTSKRRRNAVDELLDENAEDGDVEIIGETPVDPSKRQRPTPKATTPVPMAKGFPPKLTHSSSSLLRVAAASSSTKKRKKEHSARLRPEEEQIFKGLLFYYIPDNEIAPARRLRIQKAREYGAVRTSDPALATHVIVDRDVSYKDAVRVVKGVKGKVLVNEDYPIECVQFKAVLDGTQKRYRLVGQPDDEVEERKKDDKRGEEESMADRMPVKEPQRNPKRWDHVPKSTPPTAGDDSPFPAGVDSQPIVLDAAAVENEDEQAQGGVRDKTAPSDELTKVIDMMQEYKDLPLDHDDEDEPEAHGASSDEEEESQPRVQKGTTSGFEERFACARSGALDDHAANPNARTVAILQSMLSYYERVSDQWRVMAYRKAIATLKRQPVHISSVRAAQRLPGVGPRLAVKIEEIATTDRLRRLEYAQQEGGDAVLKLFLGIYGVGPKLAAQWAARGLKTLEDVTREVDKLTPGQKMGIEKYKDLNTKIPRDEVEALAKVVREEASKVDEDVVLTIGGSYRRGAPASSDVDFIVSKPNTSSEAQLLPFLRTLIHRLQASSFVVATLAAYGSIWQGCCVLPPGGGGAPWRRMDFLLVPATQMGAALIYFTGDDVFNRSLRLLAQKRGLKLNQRGLYKRVGGGGEVQGDLVEGASERRIFEILGVTWREPTQRWC